MMQSIEAVMHPEGYHGEGRRPPYFEGWYFKIVDAGEQNIYAVIPGVSLSEGGEGPHAFVQVLNGITGSTAYHPYPLSEARAAPDRMEIRVGPNHFTAHGMTLDLPEGPLTLKGRIAFDELKPWPVNLLSPGIMGWYAWIPWMECYHGVPSLDHELAGTLRTADGEVRFDGGRGYIEKDWGASFPDGWVWLQTNHFEEPGICLTGSVATIPWSVGGAGIGALARKSPFRTAFRGFIVGLLLHDTLIRFTTYTGAVTERLALSPNHVTWVLRDDLYRLVIQAERTDVGNLRGPSKRDMGRPVLETLRSTIEVHLTTLDPQRTVYWGRGRNAGLEVGGDSAALARMS